MPIRLIPASSGEPIKLDKPVLLIGRNPDCDVVLSASRKVSRNHCLIACVNEKLFIRDLGSTNGVWINGHRVEREGRIRAGDELSIADLKYTVRQVERPGRAAEDGPEKVDAPPVSIEHEARGRRVRKVGVAAAPDPDQPIPIPEEDESFVVEASAPRLPRVHRDDPSRAGDRPSPPPSSDSRPAAPQPAAEPEVLELAEPLNLDLSDEAANASAGSPAVSGVQDESSQDDGATPQGSFSDAWLPAGDDDDAPIIPLDD